MNYGQTTVIVYDLKKDGELITHIFPNSEPALSGGFLIVHSFFKEGKKSEVFSLGLVKSYQHENNIT